MYTLYYLQFKLVMAYIRKSKETTILLQCTGFLKNDARREEQPSKGK